MARLSDDVKRFIVESLACYDTPMQVAEAVKEQFGIDVTRQQCEAYDPTKAIGKDLGKKWRAVFEASRKAFKDQVSEVPIASRVFRIRALARMVSKAEKMRNLALAGQLLEQAAKEVGDYYVNRGRAANTGPGEGEEPVAQRVERAVKDARRHDDG